MKPIGGFFELELGTNGQPYHDEQAVALSSGRACLNRLLQSIQPRKIYLPFYVCDAVLQPLVASGVPYEFYPISQSFEPCLSAAPAGREYLLYVNYFGLKRGTAASVVQRFQGRTIVDDTHAFFERGHEGAWSFNSARKYFGVPDGGYLFGPNVAGDYPPQDDIRYDHLINRLVGKQELAFRQYQESEEQIANAGVCIRSMSALSARILRGIDYEAVKAARRRNFALAHDRLRHLNRIEIPLDDLGGQVPFCYPFLPDATHQKEEFWRRSVFIPTLWPDVLARDHREFGWERDVANRLLPLPIDQRYGPPEIETLCEVVTEVLR